MEMAWDSVNAAESLVRCPDCGMKASDMFDERGRPLAQGAYTFIVQDCEMCAHMAEQSKKAQGTPGEPSHRPKAYVRAVPRLSEDDPVDELTANGIL